MRPLLLEIRHSRAWVGAFAVAAISVSAAIVSLRVGVPLAGDATTGMTTSTLYTTPLVAAFFAVSSSAKRAGGLPIRAQSASRPPYLAFLPHLGALIAILLVACTVSVGTVGVVLIALNAYGELVVSWLAVWAAALLLGGVVGYTVGLLPIRRVLAAPVAFVIVFGAWSLVIILHSARQLSYGAISLFPIMTNTTNAFVRYLDATPVGQVMFFLGSSTIIVAATAIVLSRPRSLPLAFVAIAGLTLSLAGGSIVIAADGQVTTGFNAGIYECTDADFTVCLHPAYATGSAGIVTAFAEFRDRVSGTPLDFTRLEQNVQGIGERVSPGARSLYVEDLGAGFAAQSLARYVQTYGGSANCTSFESSAVEAVVDAWLVAAPSWVSMSNAAEAPLAHTFETQSVEQNRAWLDSHYAQYADCTLTFDDLEESMSE